MAWQVDILPAAFKELEKLPKRKREQADEVILSLENDPRPSGFKKLQGYDDLYRVRFGGNYRITYRIRDSLLEVMVIAASDRKNVYRKTQQRETSRKKAQRPKASQQKKSKKKRRKKRKK